MPILAETSMEVDVELVSIEGVTNSSVLISKNVLFIKRF